MSATWLVVVISRISVRPWPRSEVTWCGGDASLGGKARGQLAFQRRLVALYGQHVLPPRSSSALGAGDAGPRQFGGGNA